MPRRPKPPPVPRCGCGAPKVRRRRGSGSVSIRRDGRHVAAPPSLNGHRPNPAYFPGDELGHLAALEWLDRGLAPAEAPRATGAGEPLGDYLWRWYERSRPLWRSKTPTTYSGRIKLAELLWPVPLGQLTTEHCQELFGALLRRGLAVGTVRSTRMVLRQALEELVPDVLAVNPVGRARVPKATTVSDTRSKAWGRADAERFLAVAEGTPCYAFWRLALGTGMRIGELRALRWEDLDLDGAVIYVRRSMSDRAFSRAVEPPKSLRAREIPLPAVVVRALREHRAACPTASPWVWDNGSGRMPRSYYTLSQEFRRLRRAAGVAPITPHGLRHTAASLMLADGVPVATVAEILGHSSPAITWRVYAWASSDDRRRGADAMDRLLP